MASVTDKPESSVPDARDDGADFVPPGHEEHDRLLILSMLERTSEERLRAAENFLNGVMALRRGRVQ